MLTNNQAQRNMDVADKAAAFLLQIGSSVSPTLTKIGSKVSKFGAKATQKGANILADAGDFALNQSQLLGQLTATLPVASNVLHAGSKALSNMGKPQQTMLGAGLLGSGVLGVGAVAGIGYMQNQRRKARIAGQKLGAQLGVIMPLQY